MNVNAMPGVQTPVRISPGPVPIPLRRLHPDELCPAQKERVVQTIKRDI